MVEGEAKPDEYTDRKTYLSFDSWNNDKLNTTSSFGGGATYGDVTFTFDECRGGVGSALKFSNREELADRLKLVDLATSPAPGNIYKYTAWLKIGENANQDNVTVRVGNCDRYLKTTTNVKINKTDFTKVEFTATINDDDITGIGFDQPTGAGVLTEMIIDDVTVECIYRAPQADYDITKNDKGYVI